MVHTVAPLTSVLPAQSGFKTCHSSTQFLTRGLRLNCPMVGQGLMVNLDTDKSGPGSSTPGPLSPLYGSQRPEQGKAAGHLIRLISSLLFSLLAPQPSAGLGKCPPQLHPPHSTLPQRQALGSKTKMVRPHLAVPQQTWPRRLSCYTRPFLPFRGKRSENPPPFNHLSLQSQLS